MRRNSRAAASTSRNPWGSLPDFLALMLSAFAHLLLDDSALSDDEVGADDRGRLIDILTSGQVVAVTLNVNFQLDSA